jgi:hypothetical protein
MAVIDSSSVWREILGAKDYSTQIRLTDGPIDVLQLEATNVAELRPNQLSHSIASLRGNNDAGAPSELIQIKRSRIGKPLPSRSMAVTILTACVELSPGPHLAPCPRGSFFTFGSADKRQRRTARRGCDPRQFPRRRSKPTSREPAKNDKLADIRPSYACFAVTECRLSTFHYQSRLESASLRLPAFAYFCQCSFSAQQHIRATCRWMKGLHGSQRQPR